MVATQSLVRVSHIFTVWSYEPDTQVVGEDGSSKLHGDMPSTPADKTQKEGRKKAGKRKGRE
jgi:hypothetical protein